MADSSCAFGLYVVGWFICDRWKSAKVAGRKPDPQWSLDQARLHFKQQAAALSGTGHRLVAYLLDAAIH